MSGLPDRPDLDQLRRQARELLRAAVFREREFAERDAYVRPETEPHVAVDLQRALLRLLNRLDQFGLDPIAVELARDDGDSGDNQNDDDADDDADDLEGFHVGFLER